MTKALQWLSITWPVLLVATAMVFAGLVLMAGDGAAPLLGLVVLLFGLYWGYRGTTPARD